MKYLVDTDRVVDYLKGKDDAVTDLQRFQKEGIGISLISYGEIYEGIYFGSQPGKQELGFKRFLSGVEVVRLDRQVMRRFARLRGKLRTDGMLISDPDLLIGATALEHDLTLVTGNLEHFKRIPGLRHRKE
ncbi:MAG: type II toxin-antitoxin system VapC family toxin [Dehalococcoidia bacterium]|nr:type II toxin-antitoxin system VapC family toxin [Dehalococcoidia bacterium]